MTYRSSTTLFPVLSLLLAATMWGTIWYPLRLLEAGGLGGLWTTLIIYGAAMLLGIWPLLRRPGQFRADPLALLVLALASGWCNVAFILAVLEGTVVRVLLLFYLSPVWAILLARLILGERLNRQARWVFAMALTGAIIMLWDDSIGLPWPRGGGDWLAVSSGMGFALGNVMIRRLQSLSVWFKTSVSWVGVLVITLVWLVLTDALQLPAVSGGVWLGAIVLGSVGIVIMTLSVQYGVTHMPVHRSAIILLFELVAGAASSYWLGHEVVRLQEWIGGALIVSAAYISARAVPSEEG